nr:unnamed protein product [Digitaria exilis]
MPNSVVQGSPAPSDVCELAQKVVPTPLKKHDPGREPRLCTMQSYGAGSSVVTRRIMAGRRVVNSGGSAASLFLASLADYIENSRKAARPQDYETISGRPPSPVE